MLTLNLTYVANSLRVVLNVCPEWNFCRFVFDEQCKQCRVESESCTAQSTHTHTHTHMHCLALFVKWISRTHHLETLDWVHFFECLEVSSDTVLWTRSIRIGVSWLSKINVRETITANRSRVSIRGRPCKKFPHLKCGCCFSYCARVYI